MPQRLPWPFLYARTPGGLRLSNRYLSILRLKCADTLFYHLLQFLIFGAALKIGNIAQFIQQHLLTRNVYLGGSSFMLLYLPCAY